MFSVKACMLAVGLLLSATLSAHDTAVIAGGFTGGLVAMVAVALWGAFLGSPAIWILPVVFSLVMAFAAPPPLWVAAVLVGVFAIFHGHAHGTELSGAANPLAYSAGFVLATGLLHLSGIALGLLVAWRTGRRLVQMGGGLIALAGVGFLIGRV